MPAVEDLSPEGSDAILTRTPSGVTLTFPKSRDHIPTTGRRVADEFRGGVICGLACVAWLGICLGLGAVIGMNGGLVCLAAPAFMGLQFALLMLIVASIRTVAWLGDPDRDDNLRELAVTPDALVRVLRDGRSERWERDGIRTTRVHDEVVCWEQTGEMGTQYCQAHVLYLLLELEDGRKVVLFDPCPPGPLKAPGAKAELEWIAACLNAALAAPPAAADGIQATPGPVGVLAGRP